MQVYWLNCSPCVVATIEAIAGELFLQISGLHQVNIKLNGSLNILILLQIREDERDEGKTLLDKEVAKV